LLGLLVAILGLTLDARHQMPLIASLILLAGFWFDATYTLCVRIATGQKFASAHRSHLYQKCAQRFGHGRTTSMFVGFAVVWLLPLSWLAVAFPQQSLLWLAVAVAPLLVASIRMGAGRAESGAGEADSPKLRSPWSSTCRGARKQLIAVVTDAVMLPVALWSALALRLGEISPSVAQFWPAFVASAVICLPVFVRLGCIVRSFATWATTRCSRW
jgi:hypothetical protein